MPIRKPLGEVDEIISLIYQGPLEPTPWRGFVRSLRLRMNCDVAGVAIRLGRIGSAPFVVWDRHSTIDKDEAKKAAAAYARLSHLDPMEKALCRSGDICTLDDVTSRDELRRSEFYRSVIKPYGIEYQLAIHIIEPSGWRSNFGVMNGAAKGNFGKAEKDFLIGIRQHLERALEIYARMKRNESEKRIFEETLDRLTIGAFILDGNGRVIDSNSVARYTLLKNESISVIDGKLTLVRSKDNTRLQKIIQEALSYRGDRRTNSFVDAFRVERHAGNSLGILVRAVSTSDPFQSEVSPSAIVYISDSTQQHAAPERFVAQLFGLTPTEAELATLLANGSTLTQAAEKLGVTENTVRSYAKRLFRRMGVNRQADLVRLVLTSVALLA